jgi:hypothetical protein
MKRAVRFLPEALEDLLESQRWYASREQGLGQTFAEAIGVAVERIAQEPATFPCVYGAVRRLVVRRFPMPFTSGRWAIKSWCSPFTDAKIPGAGKTAPDDLRIRARQSQPQSTPADEAHRALPTHPAYNSCSPASVAAATPRSVIRAVTSRAGVTSKAGLKPALPDGVSCTVVIAPSLPPSPLARPWM